jgi:hypothetical protein
MRHYYGFSGDEVEDRVRVGLTSPEAVKAAIRAYADVGADELVLRPCVAELDQVDRLADVIG